MPTTPKHLIFDFGNVLVRWQPEVVYLPFLQNDEQRWNHFWHHICPLSWRNRSDAGEPMDALIAERQAQCPEWADAIELYRSRWDEMLTGEMPGMRDLLQRLKAEGRDLYGLSNWARETFPAARRRFGILQEIDRYVVSGFEGLVKPDPAIYRLLLRRYGLQAEHCLFIDDNPANIQAAESLGIRTILFQGCDQLKQIMADNFGL